MAFETAQLAEINIKIDQMGADAGLMKQYQPQVAAALQVINNQTAKVDERRTALSNSEKNYQNGKVFLHWLTTNNIVEEAISENCTLTEPKLDSASEGYNLTMEFRTGFSLDEDEMKDTIFSKEEVVARGFLKAMQVLDEGYSKRIIAKLDAFAGTNLFNGAYTVGANGNLMIPAEKYNQALFPYLAKAAILNRLGSYYLIDSGELWEGLFLAQMNREDSDKKGIANLYDQFNLDFDLTGFAAAGVAADTLLVDRSAVAFATKNRFQNTVPQGKVGQQRYKVASRNLPGVFYDVYYKEECIVVGGRDHVRETFRLQTQGDLLKNPETTYAGVLAFEKAAAV